MYKELKIFDKAADFSDRSLEIKSKLFQEEDEERGIEYANLAKLYNDIDNIEKALYCYNKSIEIKTKIFGKYSLKLEAVTWNKAFAL